MPSEFQYTLRAFQFGLATYAVTFGIFSLLGWPFALAESSDASAKGIFTPAIFKEIVAAAAVGLVLAVIWLFVSNRKWDTRFFAMDWRH